MLTAIRVAKTEKLGRKKWLCLCDCGSYAEVRASDLLSGNTGSCGCRKNAPRLTGAKVGLYLIYFKSGHVKFGKSGDLRRRAIQYVREGCIAGGATAFFVECQDFHQREQNMLFDAHNQFRNAFGELYLDVPQEAAIDLLKKHAANDNVESLTVWPPQY